MKSFLLPRILIFVLLFGFGFGAAQAQNDGPKNSCISESLDNSGNVVLTNTCNFQIHVYWVRQSRPNVMYNNYVGPGDNLTTYMEGSGPYTFYACDAHYYVVDESGRVLNHYVSDFECRAK